MLNKRYKQISYLPLSFLKGARDVAEKKTNGKEGGQGTKRLENVSAIISDIFMLVQIITLYSKTFKHILSVAFQIWCS